MLGEKPDVLQLGLLFTLCLVPWHFTFWILLVFQFRSAMPSSVYLHRRHYTITSTAIIKPYTGIGGLILLVTMLRVRKGVTLLWEKYRNMYSECM